MKWNFCHKNMYINKMAVFFIVLGMFFIFSTTKVYAAALSDPQPTQTFLKIFYFRDGTNAQASLFQHASSIDVLAPQSYSIDSSGSLAGGVSSSVLAFTEKNNIKVMPLVTNGDFSRSAAEAVLDDPSKEDIAINALVAEAEQKGYWGWQMDFEGIDAVYKDKYSAFVKKMDVAMKAHNLILSVAVVSQVSSNSSDYPTNYWNKIAGVYDYATLASNTDFISVMAYDDPESKGAIAPYSWIQQVLTYSLKYIPANKLSMGIPLYYWQWNDTSGKRVSIGGNVGIQKAMKMPHATLGYSTEMQAPFIKYTTKKIPYTLWYENTKSLNEKINLIKQYSLNGFSAWMLGLEDPAVYPSLKF